MAITLRNLLPDEWKNTWIEKEFKPVCSYFPLLDSLMYLEEDVSYRSKYIDGYINHLLHPYEDRLVGVKIDCIGELCSSMRDFVHTKLNKMALSLSEEDRKILETEMNKSANVDISLRSLVSFLYLEKKRIKYNDEYRKVFDFLEEKDVIVNPYEIIREAEKITVIKNG